jgi:hypothetical protein
MSARARRNPATRPGWLLWTALVGLVSILDEETWALSLDKHGQRQPARVGAARLRRTLCRRSGSREPETPPIGGDRLPRNTYSITRSPRRTKDWGGRFDLDALRGPASICRRTVHLRFGSRLPPESRVSVTTTLSPVVLHDSGSHGPSEPDATKTCRVKFPETFLSRLSSSRRRAVAASTPQLRRRATSLRMQHCQELSR